METKLFEVRDRMTFIPVMCVKLSCSPGQVAQNALLRRAGFGWGSEEMIYIPLDGSRAGSNHHDPYHWSDRTHHTAHAFILERWEELKTGEVVDVEYILGETKQKKESEL